MKIHIIYFLFQSFSAEARMTELYKINLKKSLDIGKKLAIANGGFMGFTGSIKKHTF
jgi:hypothetical protein